MQRRPAQKDFFTHMIISGEKLVLRVLGDDCVESMVNTNSSSLYIHIMESQTKWNDDTCDLSGNDKSISETHGFFLMNHWQNNELDLPSKSHAEVFNTYESLSARFGKCVERLPNILAVDFWSTGDVLKFVNDQNIKIGEGDAAVAASRSGSLRH